MNENEVSRVDAFRQFKRHVRSSRDYLVVGLDIAKNKHHAFFGDANGRTLLKGLIVENNAAGLKHLLTQVRFYMDREGLCNVVFGLEPTSAYHKALAEQLVLNGYLVVYVTNEAIKKNRSLLDGRWDKNDTKDSANVADLVVQGKCHYYDLPEIGMMGNPERLIAWRCRIIVTIK